MQENSDKEVVERGEAKLGFQSPLFDDYSVLASPFMSDPRTQALRFRALRDKRAEGPLSPEEERELQRLGQALRRCGSPGRLG